MKYENIVIEMMNMENDKDVLTLSESNGAVKNIDWYSLYPSENNGEEV